MLSIKINNKALVLVPSTKLRFEIQSPIFETDAIPGSYICPFDLPVAGNDVFENAEFIEINRIYKKYNCVVLLDDYPLYSGELILNTSNTRIYRCSVVLTGIATDFPENKLNELNYDSDIVIGGTPHNSNSVASFAAMQNATGIWDFYFPMIHAPNFYGSSNADYGGEVVLNAGKVGKFLNNWNAALQKFEINKINSDANCVDNAYVLVPQMKLIYIVKKIFENIGYSISGDFFSSSFINKLLFLNYTALDEKYKRYYVAAKSTQLQIVLNFQKIKFQDDSSLGFEDIDNCFNTTTSEYEIKEKGYISINCNINFTPVANAPKQQFYWRFYITDGTNETMFLQNSINITNPNVLNTIDINESYFASNSVVGKKIILKTDLIQNQPPYPHFTHIINSAQITFTHSYHNLNQYSNKLHIADHTTSNTVGSLLNALKTNFGLAIWFDMESKVVEISFLKDLVASHNYIDISDMVVRNSLEITIEEAVGYKLIQKNDDKAKDIKLYTHLGSFLKKSDLPIPDKLNVIAEVLQEGCLYMYKKNETDFTLSWEKYGTSISEIKKSKAETDTAVDIGIMTNVIMHDRLLPDSNQQGTSEAFDTGVNETDMQLLIWHGMKPDKNGLLYPFASSLKYDVAGNIISDTELRLDGESGIFDNYLKSWYDFKNTAETVRLQIKMQSDRLINILELFKPQFNKASQQIRKLKYNGCLLLPKSISFLVPVNGGFIEAEVEALKDGGVEL